jgi:hypothetical protein
MVSGVGFMTQLPVAQSIIVYANFVTRAKTVDELQFFHRFPTFQLEYICQFEQFEYSLSHSTHVPLMNILEMSWSHDGALFGIKIKSNSTIA